MTQPPTETWTVTIVVPEASSLDAAGETFDVDVSEDETILAAARSAGVWLPADCQQGWCTACAARLVDGDVVHPNARRYYDEDREAGYVLACTAKPRADTTLVVDQYDDFLAFRAAHDNPPGNAKLE
ncbi:2Fe-2S iron-sulfur cluster binding domain-containing protein [Halobacterium salinarum]|uniref:2Fe-2S iron-sulfur cluster-binding protein n=1 Tax=Halobacterium salinarum TaxID=2242 RepID=UPI002554AC81|nr:2Fe-2S iron-sulfur cluster binding domain-containing protein [Halobacterium salinarum]MDL0128799.1 2Fe-2S iron-sulfur cluster binding domain-containing protein [Halobacterium salinarum]MDL0136563.1 2Fe-2S iron-sulfur cluster binding domain-containing protein [Halobacterium salinarum]MDL0139677.1 2Fe-2S iron-sulfur cluster binding domain-containing protein [Halobacterium salinarum]